MTRYSLLTALFATLLATSTDAQAARKKRPAEKAPEKALTVGVSAGYAMPKGAISMVSMKDLKVNFDVNTDFSDIVKYQIPLTIDLGYKITPRFSAGIYYSYGLVSFSETITATLDESSDLSAHTIRYGIQGHLFFLDDGDRPWAGFSLGQEVFYMDESGIYMDEADSTAGYHASAKSLPLLGLSAGYEISAGDFKISPFLSVQHGTFKSSEATSVVTMATSTSTVGPFAANAGNESASHQWLTIGVRGYIGVL